MYIVKYGENYLHDPRNNNYILNDLSFECEENSCGYCDFTIYPQHPMYNKLTERDHKNLVVVYDDSEIIFKGYIYSLGHEFKMEGKVRCKGVLSYLYDSIVRPYSTIYSPYMDLAPSSVDGYFEWLINQHNAQVDTEKQFVIGINQGAELDPNNYIYRESKQYPSTFSELKEKILDNGNLGGKIRIRYEEDINIIDFLSDWDDVNTQILDFGVNLTNYSDTSDSSEIYTYIVPTGAYMSETDYPYDLGYLVTSDTVPDPEKDYYILTESGYEQCYDIESFKKGTVYYEYYSTYDQSNDNLSIAELEDYNIDDEYVKLGDKIFHKESVSKYGWIGYQYNNTDITTRGGLVNAGKAVLSMLLNPEITIDISAIDMHLINPDIKPLKIGEYVRVRSIPHKLDSYFVCTSIELDLNDPGRSTYILGTSYSTLTGDQNDRLTKLNSSINKQYEAATAISEEAKKKASQAITSSLDNREDVKEALDTAAIANQNATEAKSTAESVEGIATEAKSIADDANATASAASGLAISAQNTADDAKTKADSVEGIATEAKTMATGAQTVASEAKTKAESVEGIATVAKTTAESAQSTANSANQNATEAKTEASNASTAAATAQTTAEAAQETANDAEERVEELEKHVVIGENDIRIVEGEENLAIFGEAISLGERDSSYDVGENSLTIGKMGVASGKASLAQGTGNTSTTNKAIGDYSVVFGNNNTAHSNNTIIVGQSNTAYEYTKDSYIEGFGNIVGIRQLPPYASIHRDTFGAYTHTEGYVNHTYGDYEHTEGTNNKNYGYTTHVEGFGNIVGDDSIYTPPCTYKVINGHVEGTNNVLISGRTSHISGLGNTIQNGDYSTVIGKYNLDISEYLSDNEYIYLAIGTGRSEDDRSTSVIIGDIGETTIADLDNTDYSVIVTKERIRTGSLTTVELESLVKHEFLMPIESWGGLEVIQKVSSIKPDVTIKDLDNTTISLRTINENQGGIKFGIDGDGNYGYYKADGSFVPFKSSDGFIKADGYGTKEYTFTDEFAVEEDFDLSNKQKMRISINTSDRKLYLYSYKSDGTLVTNTTAIATRTAGYILDVGLYFIQPYSGIVTYCQKNPSTDLYAARGIRRFTVNPSTGVITYSTAFNYITADSATTGYSATIMPWLLDQNKFMIVRCELTKSTGVKRYRYSTITLGSNGNTGLSIATGTDGTQTWTDLGNDTTYSFVDIPLSNNGFGLFKVYAYFERTTKSSGAITAYKAIEAQANATPSVVINDTITEINPKTMEVKTSSGNLYYLDPVTKQIY